MHDVPSDSESTDKYECLKCGEITEADVHPTDCPVCGSAMQNRSNSLE